MSEQKFICHLHAQTQNQSSGCDRGAHISAQTRGGGVTTGFSIIHLFAAEGITVPSILICTELKAVTTARIQRSVNFVRKTGRKVFFSLARGFLDQIHPNFALYFLPGDAFKSYIVTTY